MVSRYDVKSWSGNEAPVHLRSSPSVALELLLLPFHPPYVTFHLNPSSPSFSVCIIRPLPSFNDQSSIIFTASGASVWLLIALISDRTLPPGTRSLAEPPSALPRLLRSSFQLYVALIHSLRCSCLLGSFATGVSKSSFAFSKARRGLKDGAIPSCCDVLFDPPPICPRSWCSA